MPITEGVSHFYKIWHGNIILIISITPGIIEVEVWLIHFNGVLLCTHHTFRGNIRIFCTFTPRKGDRKNCLRVTLRERDVRARDSRCSPPCSPPTATPRPPLRHTPPPPLKTKTRKNCLRVTLRERDVRVRDSRCSPPCSPPTAAPRPPLRHTPPPRNEDP